MRGRVFCISGDNLTLGTGYVLAAIRTAASDITAAGQLRLLRVEITQKGTTTSEQVRGAFSTRDTAGTLTCTSATPRNLTPLTGPSSGLSGNTAPAGGAARCGINSSADSGGTYTDHLPFNFNNLNGFLWVATPEERVLVPAATVFALRLLAAPTGTTGWGFSLTYEEV